MIFNDQYVEGLNTVDWDEERRQTLETVLHNSTQGLVCGSGRVSDDTSTVHLLLHTNTSTCSARGVGTTMATIYSHLIVNTCSLDTQMNV